MKFWQSSKFKKFLFIFLTILTVAYFGLSLLTAHILTSPLAQHIEISPSLISENYEHVSFNTSDNLKLYGWFFPNKGGNLIIFVAGMRGNRHDTGYFTTNIAQELIAQGYNLLLFDGRAHGDSQGSRFAYGAIEGNDVLAAVEFAKEKGFAGKEIGLIGNSTGAISILMVADQLKDIGAMVIDSAATDFSVITSDRLWKEAHLPPILHPTIFFFSKIFFGVDFNSIRPIDKLKLIPERKFLFLNTIHDETTPPNDSEELLKASNNESRLVLFPEGGHIETFKKNPHLYRKEVYGFLQQEFSQ